MEQLNRNEIELLLLLDAALGKETFIEKANLLLAQYLAAEPLKQLLEQTGKQL